ncbi:hypothetical protein PQX77_014174 [Marasmius sp. AFHP31]|nr:hypothetical protein PQX77_014174 [Marasmius sp. AFHP31]
MKDGRIYGVLNDHDLACFLDRSEEQISRQKIRTKPFIAMGLLAKSSSNDDQPLQHRARFDLESFLYVLAWIVRRYEDGQQISDPPFEDLMKGNWVDVHAELYRITNNDAWKPPPFDFETLDGKITNMNFISAFDLML